MARNVETGFQVAVSRRTQDPKAYHTKKGTSHVGYDDSHVEAAISEVVVCLELTDLEVIRERRLDDLASLEVGFVER